MRSHKHRSKARKRRQASGRSRYQKGHGRYREPGRMFSKKAGSMTHAPEVEPVTLGDVWP